MKLQLDTSLKKALVLCLCVCYTMDVTYPSAFRELLGFGWVVVTRDAIDVIPRALKMNATRFVDETTLRLSYIHSRVHVLLKSGIRS